MKEITISVRIKVPESPRDMTEDAALEEIGAVAAEMLKGQVERLWGPAQVVGVSTAEAPKASSSSAPRGRR